jgi:hypothetical protein
MKNNLSLKITWDVKNFIRKVDELSEKFEEQIPPGLKEKPKKKEEEKPTKVEGPRIVLNSKRGTKINDYHSCSQCHLHKRPIYKYSKSNIGIVYLCNECKVEVFNRSFGSAGPQGENLIGKSVKSGGGWDTNRRKH